MKRQILAGAILLMAAGFASSQSLPLKVMGQPAASGLIQKNKEQPFFENLA